MGDKKEYDIPKEVGDLMVKALALDEVKESYTKRPFGYKKAVKSAISVQKYRNEFWKKVKTLYPKLKGNLCYNIETGKVHKSEKEN